MVERGNRSFQVNHANQNKPNKLPDSFGRWRIFRRAMGCFIPSFSIEYEVAIYL